MLLPLLLLSGKVDKDDTAMAVAGTRSRGRRVARRGLLLVLRRGGGEAEEEKEKEHDNGGMVSGLFGGCLRPVRLFKIKKD